MNHAVIMAGGSGTRLWPLSRQGRPKQLLPLVEGRCLLELALERLGGLFPPERTWIVTSAELVEPIARVATSLPRENILGEPAIRDTSNAIGLACLLLARRDPDAKVGIFTADHVIRPVDRFASAVEDAMGLLDADPGALVTLGIPPAWPNTGLGYIHRGPAVGKQAFRVRRFVEKPDHATAVGYCADGQHYWNSGMFIWRADTLVARLGRFRPDHLRALRAAADAWADGDAARTAAAYSNLPRISIDFALMEPASVDPNCSVLVRELDCQWLDVGNWPAVAEVNPTDGQANLCRGRVATVDAKGNILFSDEPGALLAALGVEDLVVVQSRGVTLVTSKARAGDLKTLLARVREQFGDAHD
ncbi:MAG: Mannose-1-phosphate guanylyltransferase 1 [Phycisphaerae bacterium]|nr:Mannose-1-phosphate guanylyltransferase 1 [Phycisphaerae bacterium]